MNFDHQYGDVLSGPNVVDMTSLPMNSGVNLIDIKANRFYQITSDQLLTNFYRLVAKDMACGKMVSWRFDERTFERTSGLNVTTPLPASLVDVGDEAKPPEQWRTDRSNGLLMLDHVQEVCRFMYGMIISQCEFASGSTGRPPSPPLNFVIRVAGMIAISIPDLRMTYSERAQLIERMNAATSAIRLTFAVTNPLATITYVISASGGLIDTTSCTTKVLAHDTLALERCSVLLPHSTAIVAELRGASSDYVVPTPRFDILTLKAALAKPQVAFARDLIEAGKLLGSAETCDSSTLDSILACLTPLRRDSPYTRDMFGSNLNDHFKVLARDYYHHHRGICSTDEFDQYWSDLIAEYQSTESSVIDLIYRVLSISRPLYESIQKKFIDSYILTTVRSAQMINSIDLGMMMYFMISHKYASHTFTDSLKQVTTWYEFVDASEDDGVGWLYKWRQSTGHITNRVTMLAQLRLALSNLAQYYRDISKRNEHLETKKGTGFTPRGLIADVWVDASKLDEQMLPSECDVMVKILTRAAEHVGNLHPNDAVYSNTAALLSRNSFFSRLDKDKTVIGTLNGVLRLAGRGTQERATLIRGFHNIPISMSVNAAFIPRLNSQGEPNAAYLVVEDFKARWKDYFFESDEYAVWDNAKGVNPKIAIQDWVLMFLSQACDGDVKAAIFLAWVATGSAGKTFWLEAFSEAMSLEDNVASGNPIGYATKVSNSLLAKPTHQRDANEHTTAIAALAGKRLGTFSETEKSMVMSSNRLKMVLGQEMGSGRSVREHQRNLAINMAFMAASNHDMQPDSTDTGTRRRMRLYHPKMQYVNDPDPAKPFQRLVDPSYNKELRKKPSTRNALFTMLVEAHTRLQNEFGGDFERVPTPPVIIRETMAMLRKYDPIYNFCCAHLYLQDRQKTEAPSSVSMTEMKRAFQAWHNEVYVIGRQAKPYPMEQLDDELRVSVLDRFAEEKVAGIWVFTGVRLVTDMTKDLAAENEVPFTQYQVL